jgi:hypothetical protein
LEDSAASGPARRRRPSRRPERQQILLRRGLALGGGIIVLILIVLGVKGCLNARKHRELSDYARDVTQVVQETGQRSDSFFKKLNEPGELSVTDFIDQVNADRSAMDSYADRVDGFSAPGDMGDAQSKLELVYELRAGAMAKISEEMSNAFADVGAAKATTVIANQMQKLLASDVVYNTVVKPEIDSVLAANGIEGDDVPESTFLPEGTRWLEESEVSAALSAVSGGGEAETPGVHGLGLLGTKINGTELADGSSATVSVEETVEVEVEVQNQGGSTENGVNVSVTVNGGSALQQTISSIGVGETETATIALVPTPPKGEATIEVKVQPVPGEQLTSNNEATYTVVFE